MWKGPKMREGLEVSVAGIQGVEQRVVKSEYGELDRHQSAPTAHLA